MIHEDIFIRNEEERVAFIYTVRKGALVVECGVVEAAMESVAPDYYGGSQVMD